MVRRPRLSSPALGRQLRALATASPSPHHHHQPKVIFSGIQPTGIPHLGNYLGALRQWVRLQNEADPDTRLFFSIVDLHAITVPQQPGTTEPAEPLRQRCRQTLAALLAIGLDPDRSTIFIQSASKLNLSDNTSALDEKAKTNLKLGLFSYPVLQAADILVHRATHVPVGDDQRQHLEFARECATNFNATFGRGRDGKQAPRPLLTPPETILSPAPRLMSLQDPARKMSKSDADARSRVLLTDDAALVRRRVAAARTDSVAPSPSWDPAGRPGVANLLRLLAHFGGGGGGEDGDGDGDGTAADPAAMVREGESLAALKGRVADAVVAGLEGVRERYFDVLHRDGGRYLDEVAERGAARARANAEVTMREVREAVGLA